MYNYHQLLHKIISATVEIVMIIVINQLDKFLTNDHLRAMQFIPSCTLSKLKLRAAII